MVLVWQCQLARWTCSRRGDFHIICHLPRAMKLCSRPDCRQMTSYESCTVRGPYYEVQLLYRQVPLVHCSA